MGHDHDFKFSGRSDEDVRIFVYKLGYANKPKSDDDLKWQIIHTSQHLDGVALGWYLDLLKKNVQAVVAKTLVAESLDPEDVELIEHDPCTWLHVDFVIDEFKTWDAFTKAMWIKFQPRKVAEDPREAMLH